MKHTVNLYSFPFVIVFLALLSACKDKEHQPAKQSVCFEGSKSASGCKDGSPRFEQASGQSQTLISIPNQTASGGGNAGGTQENPNSNSNTGINGNPVSPPQPTPSVPQPATPEQAVSQCGTTPQIDGWKIDFLEDFGNNNIENVKFSRYGWGNTPIGKEEGAMGFRSWDHTFTQDGKLIIRTEYKNNSWYSGGGSTGGHFAAARGRWEVCAKLPRGKGLGYVFLLWPKNEVWPPEIDFAEGNTDDPTIMGVYHYDSDNKQTQRYFYANIANMNEWHRYGVIVENNSIVFTFDGKEWSRIEQPIVDTPYFLALQSGAMDPNGSAAKWRPTVDGGVPNALTPAISDIEVDNIAHYVKHINFR